MSNPFSAKADANGEVPKDMVMPDRELPVSPESEKHHDSPVPVSDPSETDLDESHAGVPTLTMEEKSCRSCRFLEFEGSNRKTISEGECRRMAPAPGNNSAASWPSVDWNSWCGEWACGINHEDLLRMARAVAESIGTPEDAEPSPEEPTV